MCVLSEVLFLIACALIILSTLLNYGLARLEIPDRVHYIIKVVRICCFGFILGHVCFALLLGPVQCPDSSETLTSPPQEALWGCTDNDCILDKDLNQSN